MDFIGLEDTIAKCLAIEGLQKESFAGERKPNVYGNAHLVAILGQGVKAVAMDVTEESSYRQAYQVYASGMALDYRVLRVPKEKIGAIRDTLSSNKKIDVRLPTPMSVIEIGGKEPIPEISAKHQRALSTLKFSPEGKRVIEDLYVAEAEICGTKGSWGVLLDGYITGLQGTNPRYSTEVVKQMLQLKPATDAVIGNVLKDMKQYRSNFTD